MDKHGYFNFGLTCSHMKALAEVAKKVVVVVKEDMPWINGGYDECIHISEVDYIVEDNEMPLPFIPFTPPPTKEDEMIAENILNAETKDVESSFRMAQPYRWELAVCRTQLSSCLRRAATRILVFIPK